MNSMAFFAAAVSMAAAPFNVVDFGANGDGVTDDTAAFQAAIDAVAERGAGKIIVPYSPKGYRIAGPGRELVDGKPCRGQLVIPPVRGLNIAFEGEMPCKFLYSYQVRPPEAMNSNFTPTRFGAMGMPNTCIFSDWTPPEERDPKARPWTILSTAPDGLFGHRAATCNVIVGSVNFESGTGLLPKVSQLVAGVSDPGNRLRGSLVWHQPWGDGNFPVVGAANFRITKFGNPWGQTPRNR